MRLLLALLMTFLGTQFAAAQFVQCTLYQLAESYGTCEQCPPGDACDERELTYDAWCAGYCLFTQRCEETDTEPRAVYVLYLCISDCDHPLYPECQLDPNPVMVIVDEVPSECGCVGEA